MISFACLVLQMLTSKDTNFIGYTFKKSDVLRSLESSGLLLLQLDSFPSSILMLILITRLTILAYDLKLQMKRALYNKEFGLEHGSYLMKMSHYSSRLLQILFLYLKFGHAL